MTTCQVYTTKEEASRALVVRIIQHLLYVLEGSDQATMVLAGGMTFNMAYQLLGGEFRDSLDWTKVSLFFGDERCVEPKDSRSNFYQANTCWFSEIKQNKPNIYRIKGELPPQEGANEYKLHLPEAFDIVLLGIGQDGHMASVFPNSLDTIQAGELVVVTKPEKEPYVDRITLTPHMLNCTDEVYILATGETKKEIITELLIHNNQSFPVSLIVPHGNLTWFLDTDATNGLADFELK